MLCIVPSFVVFADDDIGQDSETNSNNLSDSSIEYIYINSDDYSAVLDDIRNSVDDLSYISSNDDPSGELVDISQTVYRISASDSSGLKSILLSLFGDYETVVTDYEYRNNNNTYMSHNIDIQPDYMWIASAVTFAVVLWCVFRGVVAILCRA